LAGTRGHNSRRRETGRWQLPWRRGPSNAWRDLAEGLDQAERRLDALDQKLSRYFLWVLGPQVSTLFPLLLAFSK